MLVTGMFVFSDLHTLTVVNTSYCNVAMRGSPLIPDADKQSFI